MAEAVGVSPQTVTNWLKGGKRPSAEKLFRVADELGVSLDKLIGRVPPSLRELSKLDVTRAIRALLPDKAVLEADEARVPSPREKKKPNTEKDRRKRGAPTGGGKKR